MPKAKLSTGDFKDMNLLGMHYLNPKQVPGNDQWASQTVNLSTGDFEDINLLGMDYLKKRAPIMTDK